MRPQVNANLRHLLLIPSYGESPQSLFRFEKAWVRSRSKSDLREMYNEAVAYLCTGLSQQANSLFASVYTAE
jgi:hypothetical protein